MDRQEIEQQIDRFIGNEMSPSEQEDFCRKTELEPELKEQVKLRMILVEGELIRAEEKARKAMEANHTHSALRPWLIAACLAGLLFGLTFYIGNSYQYTTQEIYQSCYVIPPVERARGNGLSEETASCNQKIISNYEQENYKEIVELYQQENISQFTKELPASTLLYISIAFVEQKQAPTAIPLLLPLCTSAYKEEAEWLLLCCYLQINDRAQALQYATKLQQDNSTYARRAASVERLLKEKKWF